MLAIYRLMHRFKKKIMFKKLHIEPFNYAIKSVCFDFHSTNVGSSVIKQVEVRSLFYPISTCFDIITLYSPTLPCRKAEKNAKFNKPLTSTVDNG